MADFITRLIERTQAAASVVRPLLDTTYGSAPQPTDVDAFQIDGRPLTAQSNQQLEPNVDRNDPTPQARRPIPQHAALPTVQQIRTDRNEEQHGDAGDVVQSPSLVRRAESFVDDAVSISEVKHDSINRRAGIEPPPASTMSLNATMPKIVNDVDLGEEVEELRTNEPNRIRTDFVDDDTLPHQQHDPVVRSSRDDIVQQPARRLEHSPIVARVRPASSSQGHRGNIANVDRRDSLLPQPPPSINVTIGRVEVRAIMPPSTSTPRPAKKQTPKLSLEEYLKQRNGGSR